MRRCCFGLIVVTLATCATVQAQTAPPTLQTVAPTGAQRGTQATLFLKGTNIADPADIIFSEPGFSARITAVKEVPVEKPMTPKGVVRTDAPIDDKARKYEVTAVVTIAPDVPHGVHALRLMTPLGVSNALLFAVSSLRETPEEQRAMPPVPQKVALPAAIVGALRRSGEVDAYEFEARAGEELVFQVVARPIGSRLDSRLTLARGGKVIAENNDVDLSRDSVLTWRCPEAGSYTLTIEDVEHGGGGENFGYRIYAGALPYVTAVFPLGVPRQSGGSVTAAGVNLGHDATIRVTPGAPTETRRTTAIAAMAPAGPSLNRKSVALGSYGEALEAEPNGALDAAQALSIPSTVNGRIWSGAQTQGARPAGADADVFRFSARKGQTLVFEVTAQQLGSPLDSIVEVLDAQGRAVPRALIRCVAQTELTLNDPDSNRRSMRLLTWNELAPNDYIMIGDELLQVESMPTHPDADLFFKSYRGVRMTFLDTSTRNHSVGTPVYKVEVHPANAVLEPNGMPVFRIDYVNDDGGPRFGGRDSRLHFAAPSDGEYFLRLRDVRGLEGERFAYRLTVREPLPEFTLTYDPRSFNIPRGGRVSVTVGAERRDGFDEPIDIEVKDLPAGFTATSARIAAGETTTVVMIAAADTATLKDHKALVPSGFRRSKDTDAPERFAVPGVFTLRVVGHAMINGQRVSRDGEVTESLPVIALAPPPDLVVTTDASRVELRPGGQTTLTVRVERRNGFTARVPITVMNLPHGVRVDDVGLNGVMITEQETSRVVHLVAEPWVAAQTQPLVVVGRVEVNSPLRNEAAAPPIELVIKGPAGTR